MIFKIDDNFQIRTAKEFEKFSINKGYKEFKTFASLNYKENEEYYYVIKNIFNFIDLIEILKAFSANKLDTEMLYELGSFTANFTQKNGKHYVKILFKNFSNALYCNKFEASALAAKFQKVLSRCEAWEEED